MFLVDPVGVLFTSTLVGLMAIGFLLLSSITTAHVRAAVHLWVLGDAMATLARLALLGQPGALHSTGLTWLTPLVVDLLHGSLIVSSASLHTFAIRSAVCAVPMPGWSVPVPVAAPVAYALIALTLPSHALRVQAMLGFAAVFVLWTVAIAWPRRVELRGAWLISAVMVFFALAMLGSAVGLSVNPPDPSRTHNFPPMPALLLDLTSALAMTMAFTLVLFELLQRKIELLSFTDPLTGLFNRRGLMRALKMHWELAQHDDSQLALAILDLDHFKVINDEFGHLVGDDVLVAFSKRVRGNTRSTDILARWGGEEFLLLMPDTDAMTGLRVTERARRAVAASPLSKQVAIVTVSIGMAALRVAKATSGHDDLIASADARLYLAKKARNCVVATDLPLSIA
jgi:diguanylate cyclase (GGDEF)-like protein